MIRAGLLSLRNKLLDTGVGLIDSAILYVALETDSKIWSNDTNLNKAAVPLGIKVN